MIRQQRSLRNEHGVLAGSRYWEVIRMYHALPLCETGGRVVLVPAWYLVDRPREPSHQR